MLNKIKEFYHKGFFDIMLGSTLSKCISFLSSIVIVRLVDKTQYSYLAYADNLYSYIILLSGMGLHSALLKFCTAKEEDVEKNKAYLGFTLSVGSIYQVILIAIFLFGIALIELPFDEAKTIIYWLAPYPLFYYWANVAQSYLRTQFKNRLFAISSLIQTALTLLLSIAFVSMYQLCGIAIGRNLALLVVILICFKTFNVNIIKISQYKLKKSEKKSLLLMGISLMVANVFSMIMPLNEAFLINNLIKNVELTADYRVANLIPSNLPFITSSIIIYYFPILAQTSNKKDAWEISKKVGSVTAVIIGIITIIGIATSSFVIRFFYGNQYENIGGLSTALWIVYAINAGIRMMPMNILPALGYVKFNMVFSVFSCILHFTIDYFCIVAMGINGAVIAIAIVYILSGVAYWIYLRRKCLGRNCL